MQQLHVRQRFSDRQAAFEAAQVGPRGRRAPAHPTRQIKASQRGTVSRAEQSQNLIEPPLVVCNQDRKSTRLNSSHLGISYAVFCLKKKKNRNSDSKRVVRSQ